MIPVITVEDVKQSLQNFGWLDYLVFIATMAFCVLIGIIATYCNQRKQKNVQQTEGTIVVDYFFGGRQFKVLPIAMSLFASSLSGITLIGTSTETYFYGNHYFLSVISVAFAGLAMHYLVLPVFHDLKLISIYEYLDRRFNRSLRLFGSFVYVLSTFFTIPIMMYMPAMVFNQVTGADIYTTTIAVSFICILYTCIGGLRAVVWTDVVQGVVMIGALVIVAIKATYSIGGLGLVIERNLDTTRIEAPIFDPDPRVRNAIWPIAVGGWFLHMSMNGIEQSMIQRYVSLPTIQQARKAVWLFVGFYFIITCFTTYNGLLVHARYHDCDPLSTGLVNKPDQLIPLLVMDTSRGYPLLSGIFIAATFSAALSSLSTALNSLAAVVLSDFVNLFYGSRLTQRSTSFIMRGTVIFFGLTTTGLVFVVEHLGPVLNIAISLAGITYGPLLGVFIVGLTMPWIGGKPTLTAAILSLISTTWVVFQSQADIASGVLSYQTKPVNTEGCNYTFNPTLTMPKHESDKEFYHISQFYFVLAGTVTTIVLANVLCLIYGKQKPDEIDFDLLAPCVRRIYKRKYDVSRIPMNLSQQVFINGIQSTYVPEISSQEVYSKKMVY